MAYASITYTSASGTTFALTNSSGNPIQYLRQADISVTVNGVLKTQGTDYTFNSAGTAIVLATAVTSATVVISRTTSITDATVSFTAGSTLTAQDLNNSDKQNRFALQEFSDIYGALTTGTGDLSALGGFIGSAETWLSDNAHAPTTGAVDTRVDSKIDTALVTDVVAGDSITVTDNSPSSGQITIGVTNASISTAKLVDSSVTTAKIADGNVTTAKILDANVTTAKLADSNVTTAKIADNAITSAKIADGTIVAGDIAADAVTTAKILDSNVTTGKLADGAVTTTKLADSSVTSAKIVDGTIVAGDLASDSVTTAKIVDSNVTTAKINDNAVTTGKIADSAVTAIKIADGVITSAKLNAATVVTAAEQAACTPDDVTFFTTSASDGRYVNVTGDSMTGALAMGSNKITGLGAPTANADAATKQYVDTSVAAGVGDADYGDITVSGTGTVWTIDSGVVTSAKIADGTIVDGDINASAAIALSKLATGALPTAITVASDNIVDGTILNADINAAAAIAGTKISPDFGSQNVTTTGTVTGASLSPTSSTAPTNGVYLPAANSVAISTGGSGRLFVDSNGNLGVGISSIPNYNVNLRTVSFNNTNGVVHDYAVGGTRTGSLVCQSTGFEVSTQTAIPLVFSTNSAEKMRITSAGLVGVGTSSPSTRLHVSSADASATYLRVENTGGYALFGVDGSGNAYAGAETNDAFGLVTNGSYRMYITAGGNVGIGTSSVAEKLHVDAGNLLVRQSDFQDPYIKISQGTSTNGNKSILYFADSSGNTSAITGYGSAYGSGLNKALQLSTNGTAAVTIDSSQRVGIGTASPAARLEVSTGAGTEARITSTIDNNADLTFYTNGVQRGIVEGNSVGMLIGTTGALPTTFITNNTERGRFDSSGRLLLGTSSTSSNSTAIFQGVNGGSGASVVRLCTTSATPASGTELGYLVFSDSAHSDGAIITAQRDGGTWSGSSKPTRLVFSTTADGASSPSERLRITKEGWIQYGSATKSITTPNNPGFEILVQTTGGLGLYSNNTNNNITSVVFQNPNGRVGFIDINANSVTYSTSSDYRLKENVTPVIDGIARLRQLKPSRFNFIADSANTVDGFLAHEVQTIVPEAISGEKDAVDDDGNPIYQGIDQSKLVPLLTAALQEAIGEIESLKARVAALESA